MGNRLLALHQAFGESFLRLKFRCHSIINMKRPSESVRQIRNLNPTAAATLLTVFMKQIHPTKFVLMSLI